MIAARDFCSLLRTKGYSFYTGVPCSTFKDAINYISSDPSLTYVMAANEGAAMGIAAGVWLAGGKAALLIQNSGVGNLVNPLTSLASPFRIPVLMFISARAYPNGTGDEPQHRLMGATVRELFATFGVVRQDMPEDPTALNEVLDLAEEAVRAGQAAAIMVPKGRIHSGGPAPPWGRDYPLSRQQALDVIFRHLKGDEAVVSTTGLISRQLFARHDRQGNFYMQGSMGHARAIALGIALSQPKRTVIVIDGDGAALMHMGTMSTVGHYAPRRLVDIVLDNEAHGSTGNQQTTSGTTELARVARDCRYARTSHCTTEAELETALVNALHADGPSFLLVKMNREQGELPRITTEHAPEDTARGFRAFLQAPEPTRDRLSENLIRG